MEEDLCNPSEFNSVDVNKVLQAGIVYVNKKRKLQAEQLGLPLPKHNCWDRGLTLELGNGIPKTEDICAVLIDGKIDGMERDTESELESGNGSNSIAGDADSIMSDLQSWKTCSVEPPSTPSVNWAEDCYKNSMYSLESRSVTKSSAEKHKSPFMDDYDIGSSSFNYEQHLAYENNEDYCCSDYRFDSVVHAKDMELQDLLYSSGGKLNNFVLSSGRWDVNNHETQQTTEKLTIDKEFEQYFSKLML